jgi:hypothetical protein
MLKAKVELGSYLLKKYGGEEWIKRPMKEAMEELKKLKK